MVKKRKKKNAITLLALVITIVIMLLLAGVAIQMTMGENGLIAKSVQAQKEQAKAELYDTAKLSYTSLNAKALGNGQPSPEAELALSTTEFTNKYNVVGDDITDKKGTVIDTKLNVLNVIQGTVAGGFTPGTSTGTTTPAESWPKTVGGVTIPEEDKDKMILKLKVKNDTEVNFTTNIYDLLEIDPIELDYGNGEKGEITDLYNSNNKHYNVGEYILKLKNVKDFGMLDDENYEIEILQWGKILEKNEENIIQIPNVIKIYEPEPDRIPIEYIAPKFKEIPEWLFSKKVTSTKMSQFGSNDSIEIIPEGLFKHSLNITSFGGVFVGNTAIKNIPEGLFKNNVNVTEFAAVFIGCKGLTSIPEGLFKNNVNVTEFSYVFGGRNGLTSIPEGLFKNNVNVTKFSYVFSRCDSLTSIPEGLFKNNVNVTEFASVFSGCKGLTSIPEGLFKNNVNVTKFIGIFANCTGLISIPEDLFKNNVKVIGFLNTFKDCSGITNIPEGLFKKNANVTDFIGVFGNCTGLTSIPEELFKNNVNVKSFYRAFEDCTGLTNIPEGLFKNNVNVTFFNEVFRNCTGLTSIPDRIIEAAKKVKEKGGEVKGMFNRCTSASNYSSLPYYMK